MKTLIITINTKRNHLSLASGDWGWRLDLFWLALSYLSTIDETVLFDAINIALMDREVA